MKGPVHLEALLFSILWAALAVVGWSVSGWRLGLILSVGLFLVIMLSSAVTLSRTGNFALERMVRWGILAISALAVALIAASTGG